ncbi:type II toxin-antitoxin system RelE/ParE family toxin [Virgibacillus natechei]
MILLHGFTKKQQKTPRIEIIRAKKYRDGFLRQKKKGI